MILENTKFSTPCFTFRQTYNNYSVNHSSFKAFVLNLITCWLKHLFSFAIFKTCTMKVFCKQFFYSFYYFNISSSHTVAHVFFLFAFSFMQIALCLIWNSTVTSHEFLSNLKIMSLFNFKMYKCFVIWLLNTLWDLDVII